VDEAFTLRVPDSGRLAATAPMLCAGITTYSPLRHWAWEKDSRSAWSVSAAWPHGGEVRPCLGAHVVLFTSSPGKIADGLRLGADEVVVSKDADAMAKRANSLNFILDTVSASHDINAYLRCSSGMAL
jgi:uncharacterized zinc-type alcohol dehydrogenase-like protein